MGCNVCFRARSGTEMEFAMTFVPSCSNSLVPAVPLESSTRAAFPNAEKSQQGSKNSIVARPDVWRTVRWESFSPMPPNLGTRLLIVICMYQKTGSMIVRGDTQRGSQILFNFIPNGSWRCICLSEREMRASHSNGWWLTRYMVKRWICAHGAAGARDA